MLKVLGGVAPQTMDPVTGVNPCENAMLRAVYDSLVRPMPDGSLAPGLAESWSSSGPTSFELKLRRNVKFQDGTPFNAAAVKTHLERGQTDPKSTIKVDLADITSIATPDDYTVTLTLSKPRAGLLPRIFSERAGMIESPTAYAAQSANYGVSSAVGAGPYKYVSHTPQDKLSTTRWDGYWQPQNQLLKELDFVGQASELQVQRLTQGEVNYSSMKDSQLAEVKTAADQGQLEYKLTPVAQFGQLYIDYSKAPFNDIKVRQALEYAIDREALTQVVTGGTATVAWGPLPESNPARNKAVENLYPYDPAKAKALLAEAGLAGGLTFDAAEIQHPYYTKYAEALQDMLKESNITMNLVPVAATEINQALYTRKQFLAAVTAYAGSDDAGLMMEAKYKVGGAANASSESVPGIEDLLAKGAAETDQAKRNEYYSQAEKLVMDGAYEVPIYHNGGLVIFNEKVKNVPRGYTTCLVGNFVDPPPYVSK